ncbi:MAG: ASCH domain-containing protein [Pirellulales bacterium]|nr:ASCH domain-containing protein [Pirellulales bacterium]
MLLFKKKFLDAIRSGEKTQTIRLWKHRRMKVGQRSYIPGVGYIKVDAVDAIDLAALTDEDALRDGFDSVSALRQELESLYAARADEGESFHRVRFHVLPQE